VRQVREYRVGTGCTQPRAAGKLRVEAIRVEQGRKGEGSGEGHREEACRRHFISATSKGPAVGNRPHGPVSPFRQTGYGLVGPRERSYRKGRCAPRYDAVKNAQRSPWEVEGGTVTDKGVTRW